MLSRPLPLGNGLGLGDGSLHSEKLQGSHVTASARAFLDSLLGGDLAIGSKN